MDARTIAVLRLFIALSQGQVQRAANFFVKQDVAHGPLDEGMKAESELPKIAGPLVAVQYGDQRLVIGAAVVHDFALLKSQADVVKGSPSVKSGGIEVDMPFYRVTYGGGEAFAVGHIASAGTGDRVDSFNGEAKVGVRAYDTHPFSAIHERLQRLGGLLHGRRNRPDRPGSRSPRRLR